MSRDSIRDYDDDEFIIDFIIDDQGDQIDRAMDTKDEQDMLADDEYDEYDDYEDPEADAADALDREADEMFLAYQADTRRTRLVEEVDQSLAYDKGDPKRETALGWEG